MLQFFLLLLPSLLFCDLQDLSVSAKSVILYNPSNGAILYEKNAYEPLSPASMTKVATALYALKLLEDRLDEKIIVLQEDIGAQAEEEIKKLNYQVPPYRLIFGASHIGLKRGEIMPLSDLFYGMLVASGNDASNVIARTAGGNIDEFMKGMNLYLKTIGCKQTQFFNPHGQHYPNHLTTAYDMALMTAEALKHPFFRQVVSSVRFERPKTNKQEPTVFLQTNKLLRHGEYFYSDAIGGKTGYHSRSKHCLTAAAKREGRTLVLVQMGAGERGVVFKDAIKVFNEAFKEQKIRSVIVPAGQQSFEMHHPVLTKALKVLVKEEVALSYYPSEKPKLQANIQWKSELFAKQGSIVGLINLMDMHGVIQKKVPLYAAEAPSYSWTYWLQHPSLWGF